MEILTEAPARADKEAVMSIEESDPTNQKEQLALDLIDWLENRTEHCPLCISDVLIATGEAYARLVQPCSHEGETLQ